MTYSQFLKLQFGKKCSLANVLKRLGRLRNRYDKGYLYHVLWSEICYMYEYDDDIDTVCTRIIDKDLYSQIPETQQKIAEILGRSK